MVEMIPILDPTMQNVPNQMDASLELVPQDSLAFPQPRSMQVVLIVAIAQLNGIMLENMPQRLNTTIPMN